MKKIAILFSMILMLIVVLGADFRKTQHDSEPTVAKKPCYGYTIIEFGKGINCDGDTVRLNKVRGGQELAALD